MSSLQKRLFRNLIALLLTLALSVSLARAQSTLPADALLLVTDNPAHTELAMHPVDTTLQDIPGFDPISLEHHYISAFSPDRKTLAAIVWPNGYDDKGGVLHLIDLTTWKDQVTTAAFDQYVDMLSFSPDGKTLYWLEPTKIEPDNGTPVIYGVFACEVANCDPTNQLLTLPENLQVWQTRLLKSGSQLAIFGIPISGGFLAIGAPKVIVVDLAEKQITATIALDGLEAGTKTATLPVIDSQMPYTYNSPGLAWDIDANRLYIAHPTGDKYTIVDLAARTTQQVALSIGKVTSKAKGTMPGSDRMALLNPQTHQLLVSSFRREVTSTPGGGFHSTMTPLGIQAIDIQQMDELEKVDMPLFEMTLSPDSRYLVATGMTTEIPADGGDWKVTASGLTIFDAANLQTLKHIELANDQVNLLGFSADSRYAYVSSYNTQSASTPTTLCVIDLSNLSIVTELSTPSGYTALLGTLNSPS